MAYKDTSAISGGLSGAATGAAVGGIPGALIGGGIGAITGLLGGQAADEAAEKAKKLRDEILQMYAGIDVPTAEDMAYKAVMAQYLGDVNVSPEQVYSLGPTSFEKITTDPKLQEAQMSALAEYAKLAQGGMTDADKAAFEMARQSAAAQAQSQQKQVLQEMQQRGQGGSGAELIAKLQGAEGSGSRLQQAQLQQAQQMQAARLAALGQQSGLAGNIRQQAYGEQSDLAKARDIINQFNIQNRQGVEQRRSGQQLQANMRNIEAKQQAEYNRTKTLNDEALRKGEITQLEYQNRMSMANAKAAVMSGQAKAAGEEAERLGSATSAGIKGLQEVATAVAPAIKEWWDKPSVGEAIDPGASLEKELTPSTTNNPFTMWS